MQEMNAQIHALNRFQSDLRGTDSLDALRKLSADFAGRYLAAESVKFVDSAEEAEVRSDQGWLLPLGETGYWLQIEVGRAATADEVAVAEIAAALIAAAPLWNENKSPVGGQIAERGGISPLREPANPGSDRLKIASLLHEAVARIGDSLERDAIVNDLLRAVADVVQFGAGLLFVVEEDQLSLQASFYPQPAPALAAAEAAFTKAFGASQLLQQIRQTNELIVLDDVTGDARWPEVDQDLEVGAWLGVPLLVQDELFGVLSLSSSPKQLFGPLEQWLVSSLCGFASIALMNADIHQRANQQLTEISTLYQASATMTANLDKDFVLEAVVAEMVRALRVESCTIFAWDENSQRLNLAAHTNAELAGEALESELADRPVGLKVIEDVEAQPVLQHVFETQEIHSLRRNDPVATQAELDLLDRARLQSALLLPLVRREKVLGLLALGQSSWPRTFDRRELRLAQNMAGQAAVAIEHAYLFGQAQRRAEELATFQNIVLQLNTPLKLSAVLDAITDSALRLVDASNLHIYLYNEETDTFTFGSALWRDGRRTPAVAAPRAGGVTSAIVKQTDPIVINDAASHPFYQTEEAKDWGICAIAGFPLRHGDQVIGAFTATYLQPHVFTEDELLLLGLLAEQAAIAVRNARLFASSQRRLRDMSALVDMAKQVTGNLKLNSVLQTTVVILQGLFNARASTITMLSANGDELVVAAAVGVDPAFRGARMKLGEGISGEVVRKGELIYISDAHSDPDFLFFDDVIRSLLVVPLVIRNDIIGTMTVDSASPNAFSDSDIQLMTIAAAQVSIAISNARFIEQLESRAAELAEAYDELKESDRLKDELVQNVSHELRTPLTFVKGYVDLVLEGEMGQVNERQRDALKIVADKTTDITRLIEDIVTLQRINANNLQLELVSLTELVRKAVAGHSMVAEKKGLQVVHVLSQDDISLHVDRARLNQVLDNIIGNAMKFSPDGGTITVKMDQAEHEVRIVISDQGIGVPKDKQERIFERFYQVDGSVRRRFGGTGVGLAIVKRIIDAHQGDIWVESEPGQGSSFHITLPRDTAVSEAPELLARTI